MTYIDFLARKFEVAKSSGLSNVPPLSDVLFLFQRDCVEFALRHGRAAQFLDTGLGKTLVQCEWAKHIPGKVLILAPLAVANQTTKEAANKLGLEINHSRDGSVKSKITITNYERLDKFDVSQFNGVVLDESSILKSFSGSTKQMLMERFAHTRYKLCCTATPSPNDFTELGNHSEFLNVLRSSEMLIKYFRHDSGSTKDWRLKGHAEEAFWKWVSSWAVCLSDPNEAGYDAAQFKLPPLDVALHQVDCGLLEGRGDGELFRMPELSATSMHKEKRISIKERCEAVARIVNDTTEPWIVWCETNDEADLLSDIIKDNVEVRGCESIDSKEEKLEAFSNGQVSRIISKPSICGFGLNWQHCHNIAFASISYSYESFYQAIRRSWRFGQKHQVNVHVFISETEYPLWKAILKKQQSHNAMKSAMRYAVIQPKKIATESKKCLINGRFPQWLNQAA